MKLPSTQYTNPEERALAMFSKVLGCGSPGAGSPISSSWTPSHRAPTQATPPANRASVDEWLANVRDRTDELTGRKYDSALQFLQLYRIPTVLTALQK